MARLLDPSEVGLYGLLTATIMYALYPLGLDFYVYSSRELLNTDRIRWGALLKNQAALTGLLYVVFLPLFCLLFIVDLLPFKLIYWFLSLAVIEHINQELQRLLVVVSKQLTASMLLFVRQGAWAIIAILVMLVQPEMRTLNFLLLCWVVGGSVSVLVGFIIVHRMRLTGWVEQIDWKWISQGVKIAIPFLIATLAIRGVSTLDRYWFESMNGLDVLAAYVLFYGIANVLTTFLDSGVFVFAYPALIDSFAKKNADSFRLQLIKMTGMTIAVIIVFSVVSWFVLPYLLTWIDKDIYSSYSDLYIVLLLANILWSLSMVPHYALYAQSKDKPLIWSHVSALAVFIVSVIMLNQYVSLYSVPIALCISFASVLLWKSIAYVMFTPKNYQLPLFPFR